MSYGLWGVLYGAVDLVPHPWDGGRQAGRGALCAVDRDNRCRLFGLPERPAVCVRLRPTEEMCGASAEDAMTYLIQLEAATR